MKKDYGYYEENGKEQIENIVEEEDEYSDDSYSSKVTSEIEEEEYEYKYDWTGLFNSFDNLFSLYTTIVWKGIFIILL